MSRDRKNFSDKFYIPEVANTRPEGYSLVLFRRGGLLTSWGLKLIIELITRRKDMITDKPDHG